MNWRLFSIVTLWLMQSAAAAAVQNGFDVVTLRNGNIYNGKVVDPGFTLTTPYGRVTIPGERVASVRFLEDSLIVVGTRNGARYSGTSTNRDIVIQRALHPPLTLALGDIAEISVAPRRSRHRIDAVPDTVMTRNGDLFPARILTTDFILKAPDSIRMLNRSGIFLVEFLQQVDEPTRVQVTLNGGGQAQGALMASRIEAQDAFGNHLAMTLGTLERLAFRVNHRPGAQPVYNYRKRISPPALIRDRLRDGTPGPEMIALRGGTFRRGDLQGDGDGDEQPPRELNLRPFAIGLYEVTFEAYDRFCESSGRDLPDDAGWGRGRRPVVNVSWNDAVAYADWLSGQTGQRYRLPTDAEWEYAARAGTRHRFWWGDDVGAAHANCAGCGSLWDSVMTSPVGSFDPNPFGLHDTAGNVFEWVADCWNDTFENAPADGAALIKPDCGIRVIRGGAWSFPPKEVRSANRWRDFQPRTSDDTGFRLVRELDPP